VSREVVSLTPDPAERDAYPVAPAGSGPRFRIVDRPSVVRETTGARLTRLRTQHGWTQEALALKAGVNQATVSLMERDEHIPQTTTLEALANALDVTMDYLWTGRLEEETPSGHIYRTADLLTVYQIDALVTTSLHWLLPVAIVTRDGQGRGEQVS
jgi:transcriptional regulator with XRE-family HTH domain